MSYLLRWYSSGDYDDEAFTDKAAVLARICELAQSGKTVQLFEEVPIKLKVTARLPRRRNGSPAAQPTNGQVPPAVPAAEPAGDVLPKEGTKDPKWGRLAADGERAAWHLWLPGDAEAICLEVSDSPVFHSEPTNRALVCLDCAESDHPLALAYREKCAAEDRAAKDPQRELDVGHTMLCEHENESAGVPCRAIATAGKVNGKWSCKRHSRRTSDAPQVPEATP